MNGKLCELCQKEGKLSAYLVTPEDRSNNQVWICEDLISQIEQSVEIQVNDWRFLTESIWSENPAIQVLSWRMLHRLKNKGETWAADTLEIAYLDEETLLWAQKEVEDSVEEGEGNVHKDSNGNVLLNGDSVVLTKTLDVKGSSLSAKLGTVVKNIRLVEDNHEQIEGKVEGQMIVILTKYLRKQN